MARNGNEAVDVVDHVSRLDRNSLIRGGTLALVDTLLVRVGDRCGQLIDRYASTE